jgi:HTH-type transcriptional regulator / antitoxin HipB
MTKHKTFNAHLDERYGKSGSAKREEFENNANSFIIGELIKEQRRLAKLTQSQLAEKTGTQKSYISRIENGRSDIQFSTLIKIIESGFGKRINLSII